MIGRPEKIAAAGVASLAPPTSRARARFLGGCLDLDFFGASSDFVPELKEPGTDIAREPVVAATASIHVALCHRVLVGLERRQDFRDTPARAAVAPLAVPAVHRGAGGLQCRFNRPLHPP